MVGLLAAEKNEQRRQQSDPAEGHTNSQSSDEALFGSGPPCGVRVEQLKDVGGQASPWAMRPSVACTTHGEVHAAFVGREPDLKVRSRCCDVVSTARFAPSRNDTTSAQTNARRVSRRSGLIVGR